MIIKPKIFHLISDDGTRVIFTEEELKDLILVISEQVDILSNLDTENFDEYIFCLNIIDRFKEILNTQKEYEDWRGNNGKIKNRQENHAISRWEKV